MDCSLPSMKNLNFIALLVGQMALGSTIQVAKTLPGKYRVLDNGMEYNFQGRYYLQGAGHFYADHGMSIDPFAFNDHDSGSPNQNELSEYARLLPNYIAYKMLKNYEAIENSNDIDKEANSDLLDSESYSLLKKHFKQNVTQVNIGDLFLGPWSRNRGEKSNGTTCRIGYGSLLEVKEITDSSAIVAVANVMFSKYDIPDYGLCETGQRVKISLDEIKDFNQRYVKDAYTRNYAHQKKMKNYFSGKKYVEIDNNKVQFCSGSVSGHYSTVMQNFVTHIGEDKTQNIHTQGSMDNLLNVKKGICEYGLVQSDVVKLYPSKYKDELNVDIVEENLYEEKGHLFCNRAAGVKTLDDLDASHTISIGKSTSGSNFTFRSIKERIHDLGNTNKNLMKVRVVEESDVTSFEQIIKEGNDITCLFTMAGSDSKFLKTVARKHKYVNLVSLNLPYEEIKDGYKQVAITNPVLEKLTRGEPVRSVATQVMMVSSKNKIKSLNRPSNYIEQVKDIITDMKGMR